ncbi:Thiosulfate sulfurtransferase [Carnimonas sp. R-84981]|uniref:sulfurtransferase n=1 Tax=Carnimonas bestiolae TaxID=3402172 RepID=UPI003EDBB1C5
MSNSPLLPLIAEPAQLENVLGHRDLLIIDVPLNADSYSEGHVPGAVYLDHARLLRGSGEVPNEVPSEQQLSALFSELGLTPNTHVVAYDDEGGGWAGRLLWTLELLGHRHYSYLNGGIHAWRAEQRPVETTANRASPSDYRATIEHPDVAVDRDTLLERLDDVVVWDARSAAEYNGQKGNNKRLGHLPGAINLDWEELKDQQQHMRLKQNAELLTLLAERGLTPDGEIVTHCQSHHRSGLAWLAGRAIGLNIHAYPGSWKEWGNRDDTPIES